MTLSTIRTKSVSITFRGFQALAEEVASLVGIPAARLGNRAEPVKAGVKTLLSRSYVKFSREFTDDQELSEMLPALFLYLGGTPRIKDILNVVRPEFVEINLDLPVRRSDDSQDGYLQGQSIREASDLNASISFSFF